MQSFLDWLVFRQWDSLERGPSCWVYPWFLSVAGQRALGWLCHRSLFVRGATSGFPPFGAVLSETATHIHIYVFP